MEWGLRTRGRVRSWMAAEGLRSWREGLEVKQIRAWKSKEKNSSKKCPPLPSHGGLGLGFGLGSELGQVKTKRAPRRGT